MRFCQILWTFFSLFVYLHASTGLGYNSVSAPLVYLLCLQSCCCRGPTQMGWEKHEEQPCAFDGDTAASWYGHGIK